MTVAETEPADAARLIDFGLGRPHASMLPAATLETAVRTVELDPQDALQYGPPEGDARLRACIGQLLARCGATAHAPDELLVTAGASQALDLIAAQLARPGDTVVVEDPTYFLALGVLRGRGLRVVSAPTDSGGLDIDAFATVLRRERPRLAYLQPVHHNPTGTTLSSERRAALTDLARRHGVLVVADEVYALLGDGQPVPSLRTSAPNDVLSLGSFSKILAPGLRLGWIAGAPHHLDRLCGDPVLASGGGASPLASALVAHALERGVVDGVLADLRAGYARRRQTMVAALADGLPAGASFARPTGGLFVWLRLPAGITASSALSMLRSAGLDARAGEIFSPRRRHGGYLRLCFAAMDEADLEPACVRLVTCLNSLASTSTTNHGDH